MRLKLKPEFVDTKLVRGINIIHTKDIQEKDYELFYKRYPGIFEVIPEQLKEKKPIVGVSEEKVEKYINKKKDEKPNFRSN